MAARAAASAARAFSRAARSACTVASSVVMFVRSWSYCSPGDQLLLEQGAIALLLRARILELGLVALDVGLGLAHLGLALDQRRLGLAEPRAVAGDVGLRLAQRGLERAGVDDEEEIAGLDVGAIGRPPAAR